MTRIERIDTDNVGFSGEIREYPLNPRHPRSIPFISVLIRSIRKIRVLLLLTFRPVLPKTFTCTLCGKQIYLTVARM